MRQGDRSALVSATLRRLRRFLGLVVMVLSCAEANAQETLLLPALNPQAAPTANPEKELASQPTPTSQPPAAASPEKEKASEPASNPATCPTTCCVDGCGLCCGGGVDWSKVPPITPV